MEAPGSVVPRRESNGTLVAMGGSTSSAMGGSMVSMMTSFGVGKVTIP